MASLGDGSAVPGLAGLAISADDEEARLARTSLRQLRSADADAAIARRAAAARPAERIELVAALGDRGASGHADVVLAAARDDGQLAAKVLYSQSKQLKPFLDR